MVVASVIYSSFTAVMVVLLVNFKFLTAVMRLALDLSCLPLHLLSILPYPILAKVINLKPLKENWL